MAYGPITKKTEISASGMLKQEEKKQEKRKEKKGAVFSVENQVCNASSDDKFEFHP